MDFSLDGSTVKYTNINDMVMIHDSRGSSHNVTRQCRIATIAGAMAQLHGILMHQDSGQAETCREQVRSLKADV